jgi:hypothetical protein
MHYIGKICQEIRAAGTGEPENENCWHFPYLALRNANMNQKDQSCLQPTRLELVTLFSQH